MPIKHWVYEMGIFEIMGKFTRKYYDTDEVPIEGIILTSRHKKGQKSLLYLRKQVFLTPFSL